MKEDADLKEHAAGRQTTASQPQQYQDMLLNIDTPIKPIPVKARTA